MRRSIGATTALLAIHLPLCGCLVATDRHVSTAGPAPSGETTRRTIVTSEAPAAIGPYAQAVESGGTLWLAGQIGIDPESGALVPGGTAEEARRALDNLDAVLRAGGYARSDVVQVQVYLVDLGDFDAMNRVFEEFFGATRPARATVQVAALPRGARIELLAVARR